jgi:hypothetical protein
MSRSLESSVFCLFLHSVFCLCCCLLWLFRLVASPPCFYSHFGEPLRLCVGWGQKEKSMLPVFGRPTDRPDGRRDVEQRVKQRDNSCSIYCFLQLEGRFLQACSAVTTLKAKSSALTIHVWLPQLVLRRVHSPHRLGAQPLCFCRASSIRSDDRSPLADR